MVYPQANPQPAQYGVNPAQVAVEPREMTPEETAELDLLYAQLKPEAIAVARNYVLARTPAKYQEGMIALIETDFPPPVVEDPAV